jgi:hypothetical protein
MATRPNGRASAWAVHLPSARLLPFPAFTSPATCPKCWISGWYPRLGAEWHRSAVSPECPRLEHLHALCPGCQHPTFYEPGDAPPSMPASGPTLWDN